MPMDPKVIVAKAATAFATQQLWMNEWCEAGDYVLGSRMWRDTYSRTSGFTRPSDLVTDNTAMEALEALANGLHGMASSRASRWFYMTPHMAKLRTNRRVQQFIEGCLEAMYSDINNPKSGFHSQIHMTYMDGGGLGTGVLFSDDSMADGIMRYQSRALYECAFTEGPGGQIDTLFRRFTMSVAEMVAKWGLEVLTDSEQNAYRQGGKLPDKVILHATMPRGDRNPELISATNLPFASIYMLEDKSQIIDEGGFHEFPFHVFRWTVRTGDCYGVGPGVRHLDEIRMLNEMRRTLMIAAQKVADPVMDVPEDTYLGPVRMVPGGLLYRRRTANDLRIEPIITGGNVPLTDQMVEKQRDWIRHAFYNDVFDITSDSDGQNVKAAFTVARKEDRLRRLAATSSRLDQDLFEPLLSRLFAAKMRRGQMPDVPPELEDQNLIIDYLTPVARAQRAAETDDIRAWLELISNVGSVDQTVWAEVDAHGVARYAADRLYSIPSQLRRDPDEVDKMAKQADEQNAQAAQAETDIGASEALANTARARRDLAQAPTASGLF